MRDTILDASIRLLKAHGLDGWSIQQVANGARCAKGLVIHYFGTKPRLLSESAARLGQTRTAERLRVAAVRGMAGLDGLWTVLTEQAASGSSRAALALASHGFVTRAPDDAAELHAALARCLGVPVESLAEPLAVTAVLDGIELQLVHGVDAAEVRAAFDRLWLSLID